jgi:hypothetical protein
MDIIWSTVAFTYFSFLMSMIFAGDVVCGVKFHIALFYAKAPGNVLQAALFHGKLVILLKRPIRASSIV